MKQVILFTSVLFLIASCKNECKSVIKTIEFDGIYFRESKLDVIPCGEPYWVYKNTTYYDVHKVVEQVFKDYNDNPIIFTEQYK